MKIKLKRLDPKAIVPKYMSAGASGADVCACLAEPLEIGPGQRVLVPTGLALEIPLGFEVQVRPRSGLAVKKGLTVLNTPGTVDSDYRGEVKVILVNLGNDTVCIEPGERIAQWVVQRVEMASFEEAEALDSSERGAGGFGSTGK